MASTCYGDLCMPKKVRIGILLSLLALSIAFAVAARKARSGLVPRVLSNKIETDFLLVHTDLKGEKLDFYVKFFEL